MAVLRRKVEHVAGTLEIILGVAYACATVVLLLAAVYYSDIWPHKTRALIVMLGYTATAASFLTVGGYFLRSRSELRYLVQIMYLPFAAIGAIVPLAVVVDVYL